MPPESLIDDDRIVSIVSWLTTRHYPIKDVSI